MKNVKLFNVIFPIWAIWLIPPVLFIALGGNFLIDSLVIILSFLSLKVVSVTKVNLKELYKKTIFKVWFFGFLADLIAAMPLWYIFGFGSIDIPPEVNAAIYTNVFNNLWASLIIIGCMLLSSVLIYIFNYHFSFRRTIEDKFLRMKLSIILAIITTPWTYLLPTEWLYKGF